MGVDTYGRIKGKINHEDIINYIRQKIDPNVKGDIKVSDYGNVSEKDFIKETYDNSGRWIITSGFICFKSKNGNNRSLFYFYQNCNHYENLEYYEGTELEPMIKSETTNINLGCNDEAVEIITEIVKYFGGGWVDKNDCDDIDFEIIPGNCDNSVKPVRHVTMEEIYEKFGEFVVIDK